jgi:hypothetical protein
MRLFPKSSFVTSSSTALCGSVVSKSSALVVCRLGLLMLSIAIASSAQTLTATLSNVSFTNGSSASGSFDFTSAGVISNSTVVLSYPALNYTAPLGDNQDSHILIQSGFVVIELLNQHPTADCFLVSACGTSNVVLALPAIPASSGTYPLNCALCIPPVGTTVTGINISADYVIDPPNTIGAAISSPGSLIVSAGCHLGLPDSLLVLPDGFLSSDNPPKPITMTAQFGPLIPGPLGNLIPTTLTAAAQACGYSGFNWQQVVTKFTNPQDISGAPKNTTVPFLDPPGSTSPYYWSNPSDPTTAYCETSTGDIIPAISPDGMTLYFCDSPQDGGNMAFETDLVGVKGSILGLPAGQDILVQWFWTSTYNSVTNRGGIVAHNLTPNPGGIGGVTLTSINGVPISTFSAFSNKLEARGTRFELVSKFTLGSKSDGINPLTETTVLKVGSYTVSLSAGSFHQTGHGHYVYEGTIDGEKLELDIVQGTTGNTYTLRAEGRGTPITLGNPASIALKIGNDIGVGTDKLDEHE